MQGANDGNSQSEEAKDFIFGFGSIMNTDTHSPWLPSEVTGCLATSGVRAKILARCGYSRCWNFRSDTGYTALGVCKDQSKATDINGVLFRSTTDMMAGFDRRQVGYDRVEIATDYVRVLPVPSCQVEDRNRIWVYVPQHRSRAEANEDHPILQSYVDAVMQACLKWGGEEMAKEFVSTTSNWSPYFLNDTPSSRRPWLHRKEYNTIDRLLRQNPVTHFADRRHPEEFASIYLTKMMRGAWAVPRRNSVFTGRDAEIRQMHARLTSQRSEQSLWSGVSKLEVAGMGGVGKTELCVEYCYRHFRSYYGIIIWVRASTAESIASDYRQLMADTTGVDVQDQVTDEVISRVKAWLFQSKVPWLLVFDSLEDQSVLEKFVPNGGTGHVLVTTRIIHAHCNACDFGDQTMMLGCFAPSESAEMLCRAAGKQNIRNEGHIEAANELAERFGHLPLALGVATAHMRRCDVDASEYLTRYVKSVTSGGGGHLGHDAVSSSLSPCLQAIKTGNRVAWEALCLLSWLGPDKITKRLLRFLLAAKNSSVAIVKNRKARNIVRLRLVFVALCSMLIGGRRFLIPRKDVPFCSKKRRCRSIRDQEVKPISKDKSLSLDLSGQTDQTWKLLKSRSLLVVKDGTGSIHCLLARALRMSQSESEAKRNIEICTHAVGLAFKANQVDGESFFALEHVKAVVVHASERNLDCAEKRFFLGEAGVLAGIA